MQKTDVEHETNHLENGLENPSTANEATPLLRDLRTEVKEYERTDWTRIQDEEAVFRHQQLYNIQNECFDWSSNIDIESSIQTVSSHFVPGTLNLVSQKYESLDYDICENALFLDEQKKQAAKVHDDTCSHPWKCLRNTITSVEVTRWVIIFIVAILTALTACVITITIDQLSDLKFHTLKNLVDKCKSYDCLSVPFAVWLLICMSFVAFGSILVTFVAPVAAGSGIPVIKCYLNGVKVPDVVRIKTLFVKAIGVVTSVLGGLACGKEGPMIHCGAVIAAGISQGKSATFRKDCKIFEKFREDHEKRDFVSAGAAAGVAAAFGAPVGGVLFSLEEGASFWNQALTWRIFFGSMISYFVLNLTLSIYNGHAGELSYQGLVNFGKFDSITYSVIEIPFFILMGIFGGLFGAGYNQLNFKITVFRLRYVKNRCAKVLEAVIVSIVGVAIAFITTVFISDCKLIGEKDMEEHLQLRCSYNEYNTFGAIWFKTPEKSLHDIFHYPEGSFSAPTLIIFFVLYFILGCWTYGLSVSSGLFIPTLLIGAAWGRFVGLFMKQFYAILGINTTLVCPAKYAILGAAAQLGGVVRMTISLTVILMEAIGNITFGLPIMISVMTAKWVGDLFNEGVYDIHIQLASIPMLSWEPPPQSYHINASQVMSTPVVCFQPIEKVQNIINALATETHNGFPIVERTEDSYDGVNTFGIYRGIILRWQLIVLLQHKVFQDPSQRHRHRVEKLQVKDFRDAYPRYPPIQQIHISSTEASFVIDLRPYMNPSAYTISCKSSLPRIFRLFRGLGLRHLTVVNAKNCVVGMVTRKDIARYRATWHYGKLNLEELHISYN